MSFRNYIEFVIQCCKPHFSKSGRLEMTKKWRSLLQVKNRKMKQVVFSQHLHSINSVRYAIHFIKQWCRINSEGQLHLPKWQKHDHSSLGGRSIAKTNRDQLKVEIMKTAPLMQEDIRPSGLLQLCGCIQYRIKTIKDAHKGHLMYWVHLTHE